MTAAPIASSITDRFDRRLILLSTDLVRGAIMVVIAAAGAVAIYLGVLAATLRRQLVRTASGRYQRLDPSRWRAGSGSRSSPRCRA